MVWVIHYPSDQLLVSRGVCISLASNNVAEYTVVIKILSEAISLGIDSLIVYLDSKLVVSQLKKHLSCQRSLFIWSIY